MNIEKIVAEANLAPSVHNTQPVRWRVDNNALVLSLDTTRLLRVADPTFRDARLSMGAALFGTRIAAARNGYRVRGAELSDQQVRLELDTKETQPDSNEVWNQTIVTQRMTFRGSFAQTPPVNLDAVAARNDVTLVSDPSLIDALAVLNDETSLGIMRIRNFRDELRHWMRLSRGHPEWQRDGLNSDALCMSSLEANAANLVLRTPLFEAFDKLGMGRALTGEAAKTRSSHGILAFHRPEAEDPLRSGEAFYEMWLMLTAHGQAAWPMAALADDPDASAETSQLMQLPAGQRLINVLRVGPLPANKQLKARIPATELIDV